jgi:hypothetical protein
MKNNNNKSTCFLSIQLVTAGAVKIVFRDSPSKNAIDAAMDFDCDACGCSASGGSLGFSSMLNSNFVGIRYLIKVT